jgi:Lar family restriction alleviation protein
MKPTADTPKPLPCPFCGNAADLSLSQGGKVLWVSCDKCHADGPMMPSKAEAVAAWNRAKR